MGNHRHVVDDFALPGADIVRGPNVVVFHDIVVLDLPPIGVQRNERTVGAVANAALGRFKVATSLRLLQIVHRPLRL